MKLTSVDNLSNPFKIASEPKTPGNNIFNDIIKSVIDSQNTATDKMQDFMNGKETEVHEVIIAAEKAKTDLQLLVELRNKTVDMFKELTRIQV